MNCSSLGDCVSEEGAFYNTVRYVLFSSVRVELFAVFMNMTNTVITLAGLDGTTIYFHNVMFTPPGINGVCAGLC